MALLRQGGVHYEPLLSASSVISSLLCHAVIYRNIPCLCYAVHQLVSSVPPSNLSVARGATGTCGSLGYTSKRPYVLRLSYILSVLPLRGRIRVDFGLVRVSGKIQNSDLEP
jgi:hypothetical protein